MNSKVAIFLACATACLPLANTAVAVTYTESGDAGDLPATAQVIPATSPVGTTTVTTTTINGSISSTNGLADSDMYQITILVPQVLIVSTTAFVPGSNNFDTQIALFNASGVGLVANDDAATGGDQSSFSTGTSLLAPGNYYILISGSGRYPVSSSGLIFPNFTDGVTDPTATVGPSAAGGAGVISGYTGNSDEAGNYSIMFSVPPPIIPTPEPGTYFCVLAGAVGLFFIMRARRATNR